MFMDIHDSPGATPEAVASVHMADVRVQGEYGVEYHKYWLNEAQGKIYCLCTAPDAEAAVTVHRIAHGMVAQKIIEVAPELAENFLGGCEVDPGGAALTPGTKLGERDCGTRTVLFTDIVDSTSLMGRLGDDACVGLFQQHDAAVRNALAATGGREVKHTGDGIMAAFVSAAAAVRCAIQIHASIAEACSDGSLMIRIGAAAGEPVEANHDLFGSTVHLAARLCSHADPQQTLVSNAVAELCIGKCLAFRDLGEVSLKGFDRPIRVHAVP